MKIRFVLAQKAKGAESVSQSAWSAGRAGPGGGRGWEATHTVSRGGVSGRGSLGCPRQSDAMANTPPSSGSELGTSEAEMDSDASPSHSSSELSSSGDSDAIVAVPESPSRSSSSREVEISSSSEDDGEVEVDAGSVSDAALHSSEDEAGEAGGKEEAGALSSTDEDEIENELQKRFIMNEIDAEEKGEGTSSDSGSEDIIERAIAKAKLVLGGDGAGPSSRVRGEGTEDLSDGERERIRGIYSGKGRRFNKRRKLGRTKHYKMKNVSEEALQKQGEANMLYASGDFKRAAELLVEVVRTAPSLTDSYHTLGLVHEGLGNLEKSMQFLMIAAHLSPKDHSLWVTVADKCEEAGEDAKNAYCLTKAIRTSGKAKNPDLFYRRADAFANMGDKKKAMRDVKQLQEMLQPNPDLNVLVQLSSLYDRIGNRAKALTLLLDAVPTGPQGEALPCPPDLALAITSLHINQKSYGDALKYAEDCLAAEQRFPDVGRQVFLQIRANAGIAAFKAEDRATSDAHFEMLERETGTEVAEAFLKIADSFYLSGDAKSALKFYGKLEGVPAYDQTALYSKMAECQHRTGQLEAAAANYKKVVAKIQPSSMDYLMVSTILCALLGSLNRAEEARAVLEDLESRHEAIGLEGKSIAVQRKLKELYLQEAYYNLNLGRYERYTEIVQPLMLFFWGSAVAQIHRTQEKRRERALAKEAAAAGLAPPIRTRTPASSRNLVLSEEELFNPTIECCKWLLLFRHFDRCDALLAAAEPFFRKKFKSQNKNRKNALRFLRSVSKMRAGLAREALDDIQAACLGAPHSNVVWNHFFRCAKAAGVLGSQQVQNFLTKVGQDERAGDHAVMAAAHTSAENDDHNLAIHQYNQLCQRNPKLVQLSMGVAEIQQAVSMAEEDSLEAQKLAAAKAFSGFWHLTHYGASAGFGPAEVYNAARAFHQFGLMHYAQALYNKCLDKVAEASDQGGRWWRLEMMAAHNLVALYLSTGAEELAEDVKNKFKLC